VAVGVGVVVEVQGVGAAVVLEVMTSTMETVWHIKLKLINLQFNLIYNMTSAYNLQLSILNTYRMAAV